MDSRRTFIKQIGLGTAGLMVAPSIYGSALNWQAPDNIPRNSPESQGVSSETLINLFDAMDASDIEFHSVMVLRNGFVIGEGWWAPYAAQYKHTLHSLSKSFTSAAVGLAINEGHFSIESPVLSFFPEYAPKQVSENLAAMKVKHLLTMTSGHDSDKGLLSGAAPWAQAFLAAPIVHQPGTYYVYNTAASYMLSAIVQKTTGQTVLDFLTPRLFVPLRIEGADWEVSPQGINAGGFGLRIRTEDIASFSQLYLNKGKWQGKQLIPESWVEASTKTQWSFINNPFSGNKTPEHDDWQQGYGYQFWRTQHNGFRSDGLYGQFGIVLPDEQTVVAITEQSFNTQKSLNFVWDILLPGLQKGALAPNELSQKRLKGKLNALSIKFPAAATSSPLADLVSSKKFVLENNPFGANSITFNFEKERGELIVNYQTGDRKIKFAINSWNKVKSGRILNSQLPFPVAGLPNVASEVVVNATWKDANTLFLDIRPVETVTSDSITCTFSQGMVKISFLQSVARGNPSKETEKRKELIGNLAR